MNKVHKTSTVRTSKFTLPRFNLFSEWFVNIPNFILTAIKEQETKTMTLGK